MTRPSAPRLALAALLACACDGGAPPRPAAQAEVRPPAVRLEAPAPAPAAPAEPADDRVLADSGLGVGGRLEPFQIVDSDTGDTFCQVCRFGGSPKIMAVGALDDPAFREDIKNLDALVHKYGGDRLKAFAVLAPIDGGKALTPTEGRADYEARVKALKRELGVQIPLVVPALEGGAPSPAFDRYYNITRSRTLMFADGRNAVKYSAVAPADLSGLNAAIRDVLGLDAPAEARPG